MLPSACRSRRPGYTPGTSQNALQIATPHLMSAAAASAAVALRQASMTEAPLAASSAAASLRHEQAHSLSSGSCGAARIRGVLLR